MKAKTSTATRSLMTLVLGVSASAMCSAATLSVSGVVSSSSGIIGSLAGSGDAVTATAILSDSIFEDNFVGPEDLLSMVVNAGTVCISESQSLCPSGSFAQAYEGPTAGTYGQVGTAVDLTSGGNFVMEGTVLGLDIPLVLTFGVPSSDVTVGTTRTISGELDFLADPNSWMLGKASGTLSYTLVGEVDAPVPLPSSAWFMTCAVAGLGIVSRNKRNTA